MSNTDTVAQHFEINTRPIVSGDRWGDEPWPASALMNRHIVAARMKGKEGVVLVEACGAEIHLDTDADCCSSTWFEGVDGLDNMNDAVITGAEDTFLRDEQGGEEKFYSFKITTTKGYVDLPYRNSSNGYYGGSVEISRVPAPDDDE
jgi:hypothetical protein